MRQWQRRYYNRFMTNKWVGLLYIFFFSVIIFVGRYECTTELYFVRSAIPWRYQLTKQRLIRKYYILITIPHCYCFVRTSCPSCCSGSRYLQRIDPPSEYHPKAAVIKRDPFYCGQDVYFYEIYNRYEYLFNSRCMYRSFSANVI